MLKPDTRKRYEAFWNAEAFERCCLYLTSPSGLPHGRASGDIARDWEDIPARVARERANMRAARFWADAFPTVFVNFGPGCLTACIGGEYRWGRDTVWFENEPVIRDWRCPPAPVYNPQSRMAALVREYTRALLSDGAGEYYTSVTDIGGAFDILAAMRGTQSLLTDLYDFPEEVSAWARALAPVWRDFFSDSAARLLREQGAVTTWMPIYSEAPYYPLQCDFCAMISPKMFARFVLPDLEAMTRFLPRAIYHLDGPGELPHLDMLLSLPRLNAIQWTAGAGEADVTDEKWFELYGRIQRAGKGLVLLDANPDGIENLLRRVSPKGLFLRVSARDDRQAAEIEKMANARKP